MVWLSLVGVALRALRFLGANVLRSPGREIAIALVALSGGFCAGHHQRAPLASTLSATSTAAHVDQVDHVDQVKASTSLDLAPTLKSIRTVSRTFRPDGTRAGVVTRVENDVLAPKRLDVELATAATRSSSSSSSSTSIAQTTAAPLELELRAPRWAIMYAPALLPRPDLVGLFGAGYRIAGEGRWQLWGELYVLPKAPAALAGLRLAFP